MSLLATPFIFLAAATVVAAVNQHRIRSFAERISNPPPTEEARRGGATPAVALDLLAVAIRENRPDAADDLAVPALRDHLRQSIAGMSEEERTLSVEDMKAAASRVPGGENAGTITMTDPVYVELVRDIKGAWLVASL